MREIAALDLSFDWGNAAWWQRRRAEGVAFMYQDAYTGGDRTSAGLSLPLINNCVSARAAGVVSSLYGCIAPWQTSGADAVEGMRRIGGDQVDPDRNPFAVIDCEIGYDQSYGWLREEAIQEAIDAARFAGFIAVVYTARWWVNWMALHYGHVPRFDAPIIYTKYDGLPGVGECDFYTYGQRVVGKQYGGATIEGVSVDLNTLDGDWFLGPEGGDDMTRDRFIRFVGEPGEYVVAGAELRHMRDQATIDAAGYKGQTAEVIGLADPDYAALSTLPITFLSLADARGALGV